MPDAPGFASSLPLQPLRLVSTHTASASSLGGTSHTRPAIPLSHASAVPSSLLASKRAAASGPVNKPLKRAKLSTGQAGMPKSATVSKPKPYFASKFARKPERENSPFKLPAVPERADRAMTPATSTVAHSSSPRRMDVMFSSSPSRSSAAAASSSSSSPAISLERGTTLIFGRHRKMPHESLARPVVIDSTIPPSSLPLLHNSKLPGQIIALPRSASHASRIHAAVEYLPLSDSVRVVVLGQNGVRIHGLGAKRVSMKQGERKDVLRTARGVEIDFYGCRVKIMFPPLAEKIEVKAPVKPASAEVPVASSSSIVSAAPPSPRSSLPPSSPPLAALDLDAMSDTEDQPTTAPTTAVGRAAELEDLFPESDRPESAQSTDSPLSSIADEDEEPVRLPLMSPSKSNGVHADLTEAAASVAVKREMIETAIKGSQKIKARTREPTPESMDEEEEEEEKLPLPEGVDMLHILTYSIVFSGSSKLSLPDLVKHMLESQSALKQHGGEEQWELWAHDVLENNAMFGKVERHGKDASGHPLLPHYFYNPAHDPDETRAKELGGLVRPLRAAQRTGGKALDWRPVGSGRRRY